MAAVVSAFFEGGANVFPQHGQSQRREPWMGSGRWVVEQFGQSGRSSDLVGLVMRSIPAVDYFQPGGEK